MATMFHSVEVAKTHEIMARYRPIAPKPALPQVPLAQGASDKVASAAVSLHLRGRPCRARKRGRNSLAPIASKRQKAFFPIIPSPAGPPAQLSPTYPPLTAFPSPISSQPGKTYSDALTLTLLPRSPPSVPESEATVPVEQDLLQKLQEPRVIVPQPVRPVGSSISVGFINQQDSGSDLSGDVPPVSKRPEEVEEEVESDDLPAVISDSHNRVRLANSAYKEMVGQPECLWLDSMMNSAGAASGRGSNGGLGKKLLSRRISGEVMLDVEGSSVPKTSSGFSCRVKIEWACNGRKNSVNAPCNVTRLFCKSKDYLFAWRFQTSEASVTTCCSA